MNKSKTISRRKLQVDPRFELRIGTFVNSRLEISPPQTARDPKLTYKHVDLDLSKSKMNQKFDEFYSPEEVVAIHTYGYAVAHQRYSENVCHTYEKQWEDEERLRKCKSARVKKPIDPIKRTKDQHVTERIMEDTRKRQRKNRLYSQIINNAGIMSRPPDERSGDPLSRRFPVYD